MRLWLTRALLSLFCLGPLWIASAASASDAIAVVAPLDSRHTVTAEELALIYRRKKLYWADGSKVTPVNLPASSPIRRAFSQAIFGEPIEASENYWNDMYFHGINPPFVASSEEAVIRLLAQTPNAIGYVPICSVDRRASILLVIDANGAILPASAASGMCAR